MDLKKVSGGGADTRVTYLCVVRKENQIAETVEDFSLACELCGNDVRVQCKQVLVLWRQYVLPDRIELRSLTERAAYACQSRHLSWRQAGEDHSDADFRKISKRRLLVTWRFISVSVHLQIGSFHARQHALHNSVAKGQNQIRSKEISHHRRYNHPANSLVPLYPNCTYSDVVTYS